MAKKVVKVFVGEHCGPCSEVKQLLRDGRFEGDIGEDIQVDLVDIETEDGFKQLTDEVDKIPSAFYDGKSCKISIDRELNAVYFSCGEEDTRSPRD